MLIMKCLIITVWPSQVMGMGKIPFFMDKTVMISYMVAMVMMSYMGETEMTI